MITKSEALARQVSNPESFTDQDIVAAHLRQQDALIGELVEACKAIVRYDETDHDDGVLMMLQYDNVLTAAREALAKAEAAR